MNTEKPIAVLLTAYNRKSTTLACLTRLFAQEASESLAVYLVDDKSADGTADAVRAQFPQVRLLAGNGNLFWCGGMRNAFAAALKEDFEFYLWLNDDTFLEQDAISRMLSTYRLLVGRGYSKAIVVGTTKDPTTGSPTYGGVVRSSRLHPIKYRLLEPGDTPLQCDTMNGNCVLIPRCVAAIVQNLSPEFKHGRGDLDYGLRARRAGCTVWIVPGFIGSCAWDAVRATYLDGQSCLRTRWMHMMSIKGLPPREHLIYLQRHGGILWLFFWVLPYLKIVFQSVRTGIVTMFHKSTDETV